MEPKQMKKLLEDSFKACPEIQSLWTERAELQEAIVTAQARELEFSDRAESLESIVEATEATIAGRAIANTDFDTLAKDRAALRAAKADLADIVDWRKKIGFEIEELKSAYAEHARTLEDVVFMNVAIPVFHQVNEDFRRQAEALGQMALNWEETFAAFRREHAGGQKSIKLLAELNSDPGRALAHSFL